MVINSTTKLAALVKASFIIAAVLALGAGTQYACSPRANALAGSEQSAMLVSTAWLAEHVNDRSLVIINIGPRASYDAGHIPGARFIEMSSISTSQGLTLELPPIDKLKSAFEELGVSDNSRIVICFLANYVTPATRIFFTLDYLGLGKQVSLLDGASRRGAPMDGRLQPKLRRSSGERSHLILGWNWSSMPPGCRPI
jgi:rhodanese-related sulfurtransferase